MKWRRRTDDARRIKGDPPPTYAQLMAAIAEAEEAAVNLRHQCDGLIRDNDGLRAQNRALRESNLRLLNDANQMRQRLPRLELGLDVGESKSGGRKLDVDPDVTRPYVRKPIGEVWPEVGEELR